MIKSTFAVAASLLALSGCSKHEARANPSSGTHVVAVTVDAKGFTPAALTVTKGQETVARFTRTTDATCAKKIVFPALHIEKTLPLNTAVDVPIPTDTAREVAFQCGMGMLKGAVVVR